MRKALSMRWRWTWASLATGAALLLGPAPAQAGDDQEWACELLLCFANPAGPKAVTGCIKPVTRMQIEVAKFWKGFRLPQCESAAGQGSRLTIGLPSYADCPAGTAPLQRGALVVITTAAQAAVWQSTDASFFVGRLASELPASYGTDWDKLIDSGIGDGDEELQAAHNERRTPRSKTCVGGPLGIANLAVRTKDERGHLSSYVDEVRQVAMFERIAYVSPPDGGIHYQVFVNHQLYQSGSLK